MVDVYRLTLAQGQHHAVMLLDNALMHASGKSQADKIEERITFALSHARLSLAELDDG